MKRLSLAKPHLIVVIGLPGSGKTFFAKQFADTFHAPYVCAETLSELSGGNGALAALFMLDEVAKTRASIVFDGSAETKTERTELAKKARKAGYEVLTVWVQTDATTAKQRFLAKHKDTSMAADLYEKQRARFAAPASPEKPLVLSGKHTYATQARAVLKKLSSPRAEITGHTAAPIQRSGTHGRSITVR
jgi:predicted kinase